MKRERDNSNNSIFDSFDSICERLRHESRREFLKSLGMLGASAAIAPVSGLFAQSGVSSRGPNRIDVHQHLFSPAYQQRTVRATEGSGRAGALGPGSWTPEKAIEQNDAHGIATSMLSIAVAGITIGADEASRTLVRTSNEYGATLVRDHPTRFGLFASLPLPDQDGSLKEIEYALDTLKADGIALMTDYGDKWPGDPMYASAFQELNRRKAVVFVHPTAPACCQNLIPGVPAGWTEFDFDTTRALESFLVNETFIRFPDIKFIFCHSGGTMPVLTARVNAMFPKPLAAHAPDGIPGELRKLYFDVANASSAPTLAALTKLIPTSQILFGSDFPFASIDVTVNGLDRFGFSESDMRAINRENAAPLFPRLKV